MILQTPQMIPGLYQVRRVLQLLMMIIQALGMTTARPVPGMILRQQVPGMTPGLQLPGVIPGHLVLGTTIKGGGHLWHTKEIYVI